MDFIASGAVRAWLENGGAIDLGTGDFVGELALVTNNPCNADMESIGFSTLLVLRKAGFKPSSARTRIRRNRYAGLQSSVWATMRESISDWESGD